MFDFERLKSDDSQAFEGLTFPSYRHHLQDVDPRVVAIAMRQDGAPAGLALALHDGAVGHVLSLYVAPQARRQGGASVLLSRLEAALFEAGAQVAQASYTTGKPTTPALERVLAKAGWQPPVPRMLRVAVQHARMQQGRWVGRVRLTPEDTILPWAEVTAEEREALSASQAHTGWIPPDLSPFDHEPDHVSACSVALRRQGAIVGWIITHRLDTGTLRYSCSYMHPALQRSAIMLALYEVVLHKALAMGIARGLFTVPLQHAAMVAFVTGWLAPDADEVSETRGVWKALAPEPGLGEEPPADWVQQVLVASATLHERIAGAGSPASAADTEALEARWRQAAANGDRRRFAQRLAGDGWGADAVALAARPYRPPPSAEWPAWARFLAEVQGRMGSMLVTPFIDAATARLNAAAPLVSPHWAPEASTDLARFLAARLDALALRSVAREGEQAARFELLMRYPVLARLCATASLHWVALAAELQQRVAADAGELAALFGARGPVVGVRAGGSQAYYGGRTVFILRFANGVQVVYKPRPLALEAAYAGFSAWLADHEAPEPLFAPAVLARPGYGWTTFVTATAPGDALVLGRRAGALLAAVDLLRGGDLHADNMIGVGDAPWPIDLEALLAPPQVGSDEMASFAPLSTRLLPPAPFQFPDGALDASGLMALVQPGWLTATKARYHWVLGYPVALLHDAGEPPESASFEPPLIEGLSDGYAATWRFFLSQRDTLLGPGSPLEAFAAQPAPYALRELRIYALLAWQSLAPDSLADGLTRSLGLERLWRAAKQDAEAARLGPLVRLEQQALAELDAPRLHIDTQSRACEGVADFFEQTGYEAMRERLAALAPAALDAAVATIRAALKPPT